MLRAGDLRHFVEIQHPVYEQDSMGDMTPTWTLTAKVWAKMVYPTARQFVAADAEQSRVVTRIIIRERADVDATCRVLHGGKVYTIEGVLPDPDSGREFLSLVCSEGLRPEENDAS